MKPKKEVISELETILNYLKHSKKEQVSITNGYNDKVISYSIFESDSTINIKIEEIPKDEE